MSQSAQAKGVVTCMCQLSQTTYKFISLIKSYDWDVTKGKWESHTRKNVTKYAIGWYCTALWTAPKSSPMLKKCSRGLCITWRKIKIGISHINIKFAYIHDHFENCKMVCTKKRPWSEGTFFHDWNIERLIINLYWDAMDGTSSQEATSPSSRSSAPNVPESDHSPLHIMVHNAKMIEIDVPSKEILTTMSHDAFL